MRIHHSIYALLVNVVATQTLFAGVTITGTRIIFPAQQNSITIQLNNPSDQPALIQAWLDDGDANDIPDADRIPFILTPPLTRIEAQKGQMIRLIAKETDQLPQDRESLYWFNILDIPATTVMQDENNQENSHKENQEENKLQVSIRSRIKVFYRPKKLKASPEKAYETLGFNYSSAQQLLHISNPSPYFINFSDLTFNPQSEKTAYSETLMLAPFSQQSIRLPDAMHLKQVKYSLINDFGGTLAFEKHIESTP
ncbi:fimbrial biogenesis chaperone [Acinetobacter larvae]|uniref:Fimbrial chaperone protein n=1 Tax=Acinetobacter larvae TaxID=1789224 RepID=A0A1B2M022_9GAMM|nr:molecular chaperone [Acinetobacter larvae]AOA58511.1 fimbrial chaperone protein [Acinetobacter larvae]